MVNDVNLNGVSIERRPSGKHHGDLRRVLEETALDLVAERGVHGFALAEVCRRAGVSVGAPYKHFADREALLAALAAHSFREQHRRYEAAIATGSEPGEQLAAFAVAYVRFAAQERTLFELAFTAGLDKSRYPELMDSGTALFDMLMPIARTIAPDENAAFDLLVRIAAAAHGLALLTDQGFVRPGRDTPEATEEQAARSAQALIAEARTAHPR